MKFEQFKNAMDSHFQSNGNTLNTGYLFDGIENTFKNTATIQAQIENFRVRPHNPPFMALLEYIKGILSYEEINGIPTTAQIKKYFDGYGCDYQLLLEPLTDEVVATRKELKA